MKRVDESKFYVGARFAKWEIVGPAEIIDTKHGRRTGFPCRCECGTHRSVTMIDLSRTKSCGCAQTGRPPKEKPLEIGEKRGKLTVIGERFMGEFNGENRGAYLCRCECGNEKAVTERHLIQGDITSCGCMLAERARKNFTTHGLCEHRLNNIWGLMKRRCLKVSSPYYKDYGGRGITFCQEWMEFKPFYDWAMANGYDSSLTLDRIDVNGNYCPENCRWTTVREQNLNQRRTKWYECFGECKRMSEWAEDPRCAVNYYCLIQRVKHGWKFEDALTTPKMF